MLLLASIIKIVRDPLKWWLLVEGRKPCRVNGLQRSALIRAYISVPFPDFTFGQYLREAIWIVFYGRSSAQTSEDRVVPFSHFIGLIAAVEEVDDIADGGVQTNADTRSWFHPR